MSHDIKNIHEIMPIDIQFSRNHSLIFHNIINLLRNIAYLFFRVFPSETL
jgi:hypothetical protein